MTTTQKNKIKPKSLWKNHFIKQENERKRRRKVILGQQWQKIHPSLLEENRLYGNTKREKKRRVARVCMWFGTSLSFRRVGCLTKNERMNENLKGKDNEHIIFS